MAVLSKILDMIKTLSENDFIRLKRAINEHTDTATTLSEHIENLRFTNGRVCPICGSIHVVRNGHRKDGKQRFICRDCGKSFVINTNSITAGTHKDIDVWQHYIECMMNGFSIRKTAKECEISNYTAFLWRHKILDALQNMQSDVLLNGIVEADETFFAVSYKGNHKHSKYFIMPRKSRHRGSSIHTRGLSKEQVCVLCAVNRNGLSYAKIGKLGKVSEKCLEIVFNNRIKENSTLCTDKEKSYRKFSENNELNLIQLDTGKTVRGIYHIQHINNYHKHLKDFIG